MAHATSASPSLKFLQDRWDHALASTLDEPELLRYRSNLLGSDLRITNFAGGNTSSKIAETDPLTGETVQVLWVKGSGGDLGSIRRAGFATLYQHKFLALEDSYKGIAAEDDMVAMYPGTAFRNNPVAASIDTPLHGFLPFAHCDHLHPDWGIALAASANGKSKMDEFNREFGRSLVWMPWLRPGFELGLRMRRVVAENPACDGIVLGGHGLFTWGESPYACYRNTLSVIDQIGQFIERHGIQKGPSRFGGEAIPARPDRQKLALEIAPCLRGSVSAQKRYLTSFSDAPDVLQFVNSVQGRELAFLGTSCPDHFIRTKIRPLFIPWPAGADLAALKAQIGPAFDEYREQYRAYYQSFAKPDSPALRDTCPTVVLIPGLGMFSFGKNKTEARIVGEFYTNAIHVIEGATLLADQESNADRSLQKNDLGVYDLSALQMNDQGANDLGAPSIPRSLRNGWEANAPSSGRIESKLPQCGDDLDPASFKVCSNYVALPAIEAFRIEYWAMEDAKLRRQPPEKELSRRIALVVGDGTPGNEATVLTAARDVVARGAHVVVASPDQATAARVAEELKSVTSPEFVVAVQIDLQSRESIAQALRAAVQAFGGLDMVIDASANQLLAAEASTLFAEQGIEGS